MIENFGVLLGYDLGLTSTEGMEKSWSYYLLFYRDDDSSLSIIKDQLAQIKRQKDQRAARDLIVHTKEELKQLDKKFINEDEIMEMLSRFWD